jgi:DNA-binding CsgD family transcriptional regulator
MSIQMRGQTGDPPSVPAVGPAPDGTLGQDGAVERIPSPRRPSGEPAGSLPATGVLPRHAAPILNEGDLQLLRHLVDGRSTAQIAAAMSVTSNTTRTRIRRVQRKLATPHRDRVVEAAHRLGVV